MFNKAIYYKQMIMKIFDAFLRDYQVFKWLIATDWSQNFKRDVETSLTMNQINVK